MSKKFYCSNPTYIVILGDPDTHHRMIHDALGGLVKSIKNGGRKPVFFTVESPFSDYIKKLGEVNHIPTRIGSDVAELMSDLDGRRLNPEHKLTIMFQTPEYAGSDEALQALYCTRAIKANLHMFSNFHHQWLNCSRSADWVRKFNNGFLKTLNCWSMSEDEKKQLFSKRIRYLYKYAPDKLLAKQYR